MTPTEINTAIAEWMGPRLYVVMKHGLYYRPNAHGYTANLDEAWKIPLEIAKRHEYPGDDPVTIHEAPPPNYYGDLNAIAEAEDKMTRSEAIRFELHLQSLLTHRDDWRCSAMWHTTAPQRCIALLITIGKYKDETHY